MRASSTKKRKGKEIDPSDEHGESIEEVISADLEQVEHEEVQGVKFLGKRTPTSTPHMQCYTNVEVMDVLAGKLSETQYRRSGGTTCFAQLSSIRRCHVQAQLIRCMFLREIVGSSKDAIMIHVNGTSLRFTIRDFAIIARLKCSDNEFDFLFNTEEPNKIIHQYFDVDKPITKKHLVDNFNNKVWGDNDDDALKFATKKDFPRLDYFAKGMFRDDNNPLIFHNISATPMENLILDLPPEYVEPDATPTHIAAAINSDDDFQDPPCPDNNKGKEKVQIRVAFFNMTYTLTPMSLCINIGVLLSPTLYSIFSFLTFISISS